MRKIFLLIALCWTAVLNADLLTDIIGGSFSPKTLPAITDMGDGEHYAVIADGSVISVDYKTGNSVDTIFSSAKAKGQKIDGIDQFVFVPGDRYMLLSTQSEKIFRRSRSAFWYIYDRQKNEIKPLSEDMPLSEPVVSPNGKYIAFSRNNNIFIHKIDFGTEVAVTTDGKVGSVINGTTDWLYEEEFSTTCSYSFSDDSKQLAFLRFDETDVPAFSWQTMLTGTTDKTGYPELHTLKYPRAGEQNSRVQAIVYDMHYKSLKPMQLPAESDCYMPRIGWTRAADQLAVFRLNRNQNKLEMFVCNSKSAVAKLVYTEENKNGYIDYSLIDDWQFFADNTMLVVTEQTGYRQAFLYTTNGQKLRQLTDGNCDITRVYNYEPQSQTIIYQAAAPTPLDRQIFSRNAKKNKTTCLTPERGFHSAQFSTDCKYMILCSTDATTPQTYIVMSRDGKTVRTLLNNAELQDKLQQAALPEKRFFHFRTERGDTLNGWIMLPEGMETLVDIASDGTLSVLSTADSNLALPLLLYQYSGPASQQVLNRFKIDWEHYLVKEKGIVVACVDPRGTDSRGRDFRQLTYMSLGQKEAEDQISAAHYLASIGLVDADKMAIWGWSYGGFQTLMTMSQSDSPFRCGIAVAPVTDFRLYDSAYTERFMRRPQANEYGYKACALPLFADQLQGRVLLVHGLADDNVHCQNMWVYVDALVRAGKQFDMQIYPDDNHFLRQRSNYQHLYRRMTDFIDLNLIK